MEISRLGGVSPSTGKTPEEKIKGDLEKVLVAMEQIKCHFLDDDPSYSFKDAKLFYQSMKQLGDDLNQVRVDKIGPEITNSLNTLHQMNIGLVGGTTQKPFEIDMSIVNSYAN